MAPMNDHDHIGNRGGGGFNFGPTAILLIIAIVCFVLAAFGVALGEVALVPLGLAFFAAAHLV